MTKKHNRSNSLVYLLERTLRQARHALQGEFKKENLRISIDQWLILQEVAIAPGSNQQQLARSCAKDPASVTRILALLQKKKWITRAPGKTDKRTLAVSITPPGKKTLHDCARCVERFRKTAGKGLEQSELNLLKAVLDKLFENSGGRV